MVRRKQYTKEYQLDAISLVLEQDHHPSYEAVAVSKYREICWNADLLASVPWHLGRAKERVYQF